MPQTNREIATPVTISRFEIIGPLGKYYFSTISSTPMGQALTQAPQEMHLEAGFSGFSTMTFMGQTSTH